MTAYKSCAGSEPALGPALGPAPWDRRDLAEARADLAAWIGKWQGKYPRLVAWVEDNIEETLTFYRLPRQHHRRDHIRNHDQFAELDARN